MLKSQQYSTVLFLLYFLLFITQLLLCNYSTIHCQQQQFHTINVRIPSNTPSGNIFLEGTLYLPYSTNNDKNQTTKYAATVLVHGSGSSNRNETVTNYEMFNVQARPNWKKPNCGVTSLNIEPFYEIAMDLVIKSKMIVLTYDKRNCCRRPEYCKQCYIIQSTQRFSDGCYYACTQNATPQKVDFNKYSLEDDMLDALNALNYLTTRSDVNVKKLTILGHSQGTIIVPKTAALFNQQQLLLQQQQRNKNNNKKKSNNNLREYKKKEATTVVPQVTNIFLMNGYAKDWGALAIEQFERSKQNSILVKQICEKEDPNSPLIIGANNNIAFLDIALPQWKSFLPLFKEGLFPLDISYDVGGWMSGYYIQTLFNYSQPETIQKLLNEKSGNGVLPVVCSLNSPTDLNLPSIDYEGLIAILKKRQRTQIQVIDNLTHFDSPADFSSSKIIGKVLDYIRMCLTQE
ncbi:hypothetical protein ABK040_002511 [Willaertia magna]